MASFVTSSSAYNPDTEPNWLDINQFTAKTNFSEKIGRAVNEIVFGTGFYGIYAMATGSTGLGAAISFLSAGLAARKIVSTALGYLAYPAAFTSLPIPLKKEILLEGDKGTAALRKQGFLVKKITLYKSSTAYDARVITHRNTVHNGNWILNAVGNAMTMEEVIWKYGYGNFADNCNTLLINGPSVVQSGGWPTRYQMGAGFEAGICYLEEVVGARHIILKGLSLGGGMIAEAISQHSFAGKKAASYLCITDRSFSRLSDIASVRVSRIAKPIFFLAGMELDGVAAAKKLSDLGIRHIIIQHALKRGHGTDGIISDEVSLAAELQKDATLSNKLFIESSDIHHNYQLPPAVEARLKSEIKKFLAGS